MKEIRSRLGYSDAQTFILEYSRSSSHQLSERQKLDIEVTVAENARIMGEGSAWARHLKILRSTHAQEELRLQLWCILGMARMAIEAANMRLALRLLYDAQALARHAENLKDFAWSLRGIADVLILSRQELDIAAELLNGAERYFEKSGHEAGLLWTRQSRGDLFFVSRRATDAYETYRTVHADFSFDLRGAAFSGIRWFEAARHTGRATRASEHAGRESKAYFDSMSISKVGTLTQLFGSNAAGIGRSGRD